MELQFLNGTEGFDTSDLDALYATFQRLLSPLSHYVFIKDINHVYVAGSEFFAKTMGVSSLSEIIGRTDADILGDSDLAARYDADDDRVFDSNENLLEYVAPFPGKNDEVRYGRTSKYILRDLDGKPFALLGIQVDVTQEVRALQRYNKEVEHLFTLPEDTYAAIFFDINTWRIADERRRPIRGYSIPAFTSIKDFLAIASAQAQGDVSTFYENFSPDHLRTLYENGQNSIVYEYSRTFLNGEVRRIREIYRFVFNPQTNDLGLMLIIRDVAEGEFSFSDAETAIFDASISQLSMSPCYISDIDTHELLHMTNAAMELYGISDVEEYRGRKCYNVIMGEEAPCAFCPNKLLAEGREHLWDHFNECTERWYEKRSSLIRLDGRACHLMIANDITERKEEMSLLSGLLGMEDVILSCVRMLTHGKDIDTAVGHFLKAVGGYYQADRAYIFEFDFERGLFSNTFEWCREGIAPEIENLQRLPINILDNWIEKFKSDGEFSISSVSGELNHNSEEFRILESQGIRSLMAAPLTQNGTIVGFVGVDDPAQHEGDLTLLLSLSEFVQVEIDRRRLMDYMSHTDSLTGLKNRNQYDRALKEYSRRTPDSLGVVFAELNGLRGLNATYGMSYGDYVLRKTAQILKRCLSGTVFRIDGDEFVALIEDISRDAFEREVLSLRQTLSSEPECSVSIGCAWREREEDTQSILAQAGEMRTAEKQSYYHTLLGNPDNPVANAGFPGEVMKEIADGHFMVYYQPQVNIETGQVIGAEALVRKTDDTGALVPPSKFIPLYEMQGVISHVDIFVMKEACRAMRKWMDQGYHLHLSVNCSRVTLLEPGIVDTMRSICAEHNVPPSAITVEVTESISKMDHDKLRELLDTISSAGFTVSLDDFGSQYSNLSILSVIDFNEIKFDRSLVDKLEENRKSRVVLENSIKMCHELEDTCTLAEGVETAGQLEILRQYHCDYGQGYYFSKPVPESKFEEFLQRGSF